MKTQTQRPMSGELSPDIRHFSLWALAFSLALACAHAQPIEPAPSEPPSPSDLEPPQRTASPRSLAAPLPAVPVAETLGVWVPLGPAPTINGGASTPPDNRVCGAIEAIAAHPTNPNILYIGAVNGGVWRTFN